MLVGSSGTGGREADLPRSTTGWARVTDPVKPPWIQPRKLGKRVGTAAAHDRLANGRVTKSVTTAMDSGGASGHPRTVCPGPGMLRRWQSASVLGFRTKRPLALPLRRWSEEASHSMSRHVGAT